MPPGSIAATNCSTGTLTAESLDYICLNIGSTAGSTDPKDWCVIPAVAGAFSFPSHCVNNGGQTVNIEQLSEIVVAPNQTLYLYDAGAKNQDDYASVIAGTYYTNNDLNYVADPPKTNIKKIETTTIPTVYSLSMYPSINLLFNCAGNCAGTSAEVCPNYPNDPIPIPTCTTDKPTSVPPPVDWTIKIVPDDETENTWLIITFIIFIILVSAVILVMYNKANYKTLSNDIDEYGENTSGSYGEQYGPRRSYYN